MLLQKFGPGDRRWPIRWSASRLFGLPFYREPRHVCRFAADYRYTVAFCQLGQDGYDC